MTGESFAASGTLVSIVVASAPSLSGELVLHAAMAVATGQCNVAVAWRSRKRADKATRVWARTPEILDDYLQWTRPPGVLRPVDEIAMLMRRHMHR